MTAKQEAIVLAQLNDIMNNIELFKAARSTDCEAINYPPKERRIKIIEIYAYLYKHPELVVDIFEMDRNTFYFDRFVANNALVNLSISVFKENKSPSEAVKEYKRKRK